MTVYLIHLHSPLRNGNRPCRHYVGYTKSLDTLAARLDRHRSGRGAKFMARAEAAGIAWDVAWVLPNGDRRREIDLKRAGARSLCPICRNSGTH